MACGHAVDILEPAWTKTRETRFETPLACAATLPPAVLMASAAAAPTFATEPPASFTAAAAASAC